MVVAGPCPVKRVLGSKRRDRSNHWTMRYLAIGLAVAYLVNVLVAAREARRYRLPVRAVLHAQLASFKKSLTPLAWVLIAAPVVVSLTGLAEPLRQENLVAIALYYGFCIVLLWLLSAWPFSSPQRPPG